jgi:hypothetical protein
MYFGLHVKYRYYRQILVKCEFYWQILKVTQILNFRKSDYLKTSCNVGTD